MPEAERISALVGGITLPSALLGAYVLQCRARLPLVSASCLALSAFYLGSKLVNEPYLYLWVPLMLWELGERPSEDKEFLLRASYGLAFAFATVDVPILLFLAPLYLALASRSPYPEGIFRSWGLSVWPWREHAVILAALATAFTAIMVYAVWRLSRKGGRDEACAG